MTDAYCQQYFTNSRCVAGVCQCDVAYYASSDHLQCHRYQLGAGCQQSEGCQAAVSHSMCDVISHTCLCADGYQAATNISCVVRPIGWYTRYFTVIAYFDIC